ncbi:MAG TPA: polysaccharide biosynthesis tyrosine autokinase [Vicingaceae bacterium]
MNNSTQKNVIESFDFKALGARMLKYWYLFALSLLIGWVVSYYKIRYSVPIYKTYGKTLLKDEYSAWGEEYFIKGMELVSARNRLTNEIGIISSYNLMRSVLDEVDFSVFYYDIGNIKTTELYKSSPFIVEIDTSQKDYRRGFYYLKINDVASFSLSKDKELENQQTFSFNQWIDLNGIKVKITLTEKYEKGRTEEKLLSFAINDLNSLAKVYQSSIQLETEPMESSILKFSLTGSTIEKEVDFINALMKKYIENGLKESSEIATNTIKFVDEQLKDISGDLRSMENKIEDFKVKNNDDKLQINNNNLVASSNELIQEYLKVKFEYDFYQETIKNLNNADINKIFIPNVLNVSVQDPLYRSISELMSLYVQKNRLETQASDSSTSYQLLVEQIKTTKNILIANIESRLMQTKFTLDQLTEQLVDVDGKLKQMPAAESEFIRMNRIYELNNGFYNYLLQKRSEAAMAEASNVPKAKILEPASSYTVSYVGIVPSSVYTFNFGVAFAIPFLMVLLIFLFNTKIMEKGDIESLTTIPIIGTVGHVKSDSNLVILNEPKSVVSESFRAIRTNINYLTKEKKSFTVLITSSISGEGKTFCSINLASAYSLTGKKTLLIGGDLRKPKIFNDFNLSNTLGLSSFLIGKASLQEVTQATSKENLFLISSGPVPPNPSELIETEKMDAFFEEAKKIYDVIIIDTPPIGLVTDAMILTKHVDVNLYVVRQRYTHKNHLELVNQLYVDKKMVNVGIIVNDLKEQRIGYRYGYNYGYGYGYGYGYSYGGGYYAEEEEEDTKRDTSLLSKFKRNT